MVVRWSGLTGEASVVGFGRRGNGFMALGSSFGNERSSTAKMNRRQHSPRSAPRPF